MPNGIQQYTKLEHRLVLLAWLNHLLGYGSNRELLKNCEDSVSEGYGPDGHSYLHLHLLARGSRVHLSETALAHYDDNIRQHLAYINRYRPEPITLRYFQYLAALYTEIALDHFFNHRAQWLTDLNAFVTDRNAQKVPGEPHDPTFTENDLTKLAYWMATGSGKTLLLHLNYYQYLHYSREPLDNILLITPNEGLSEQHLQELALSGIPARRFDLHQSSLFRASDEVQVLEITKLVEQKRGGGVSVPVEAFEGRNLIFVDEGHKGSGGQVWRGYRDALGATGFTFEYSATFGQALTATGDDDLTQEYGKAIAFDYSYRYFYGDGFGKDFRILNLQDETRSEHTEMLLLGNLLSFYEQLRLYQEQQDALRPYNLEKPLWVFVGSTVNAVYTARGKQRSDVLTVARFLHHVLSDRAWAVATIGSLLKGQSGLRGLDGGDVFGDRFAFLKGIGQSVEALYADILRRIFNTPTGGGLHLADIRGSQGEIGLKAASGDRYFGLIYIGDTPTFKKLVETKAPEITVEDDAVGASLFGDINRPDSCIHVLIGAKKFMEGWNSWRVANMGLLNIGRSEGSQIIQLFGRGVRLKGRAMSLKRSAALEGQHPQHIRILETLNIFAVRANYMTEFRGYLEREGVETGPIIELPLFTWINEPALRKDLVILRTPDGRDFVTEQSLALEADPHIQVRMDMSVKVQAMTSTALGVHQVQVQAGLERQIPAASLALVDWERVYLDLLDYKAGRGWHNLIIRPQTPQNLITQIDYRLIADEVVVCPRSFSERNLLQAAVTNILRKYLDTYYRHRRERWEMEVVEYRTLDENDPNLAFNRERVSGGKPAYIVQIRRSDIKLLEAVEQLLRESERLYRQEDHTLSRIHFDGSLYLPLLVEQMEQLQTIPPALNASETQFLRALRDFWQQEKDRFMAGKELYVLRNLSRGKGVVFFENGGFYPDFILWVVDSHHQRIIFVDPHGMSHAKAYKHDEKARLHERLPILEQEISRRSGRSNVSLDAFLVSATPFNDLHKHYEDGTWDRSKFAEKHILFPERNPEYDFMKLMFG